MQAPVLPVKGHFPGMQSSHHHMIRQRMLCKPQLLTQCIGDRYPPSMGVEVSFPDSGTLSGVTCMQLRVQCL